MAVTAYMTYTLQSTTADITANQTLFANGADMNKAYTAIDSIQRMVGMCAEGTFSTVAERLDNLEGGKAFHVYSITALTYGVNGGAYEIGGTVYEITNVTAGLTVATSVTTYVYLTTSTAIQTNTTGFPSATAAIQLATITSDSAEITAVADKRPFLTSYADHASSHATGGSDSLDAYMAGLLGRVDFNPEFQGAILTKEGSTAIVTWKSEYSAGYNYYYMISTAASTQDSYLTVEYTLPKRFRQFSATGALTFNYATGSTDSADNSLTVHVFKNDTSITSLSCSASATTGAWTTKDISATAIGTTGWTAYDTMHIKFQPYSKNNHEVRIGRFYLDFS